MKPAARFSALLIPLFLFSSLFLVLCNRTGQNNGGEGSQSAAESITPEPELAEYMGSLQQFAHKFALSAAAENRKSADFYLHELEEVTENIQKDVPEYEGQDIAGLVDSMLEPRLEDVDIALDANNWQETRSKLIKLIDACNSCHHATEHGFIEITPGFDTNPYNQAF